MASGTIVEEGGGNDGATEKQRFTERKVYTRKAFKGPKNNINNLTSTAPKNPTTVATTTSATTTNENEKAKDRDLTTPSTEATATTTTAPATADEKNKENGFKDDANEKENENNTIQVPESQTPGLEDTNSAQQPPVVRQDANSDDSSGLNRQQDAADVANSVPETPAVANSVPETPAVANSVLETPAVANSVPETPAENGVVKQGLENKVRINLRSKSKQEKIELRRKLESELDIIRSLVKKIEAKEGPPPPPPLVVGFSNSHVNPSDRVDNGFRRVNSDVGIPREITTPVVTPTPRQSRPLNQLSVAVLENSQGGGEFMEKEKRTPKANQFYRNSEFLLAKDKFPPAESNKKSKLNGKRHGGGDLAFGFSTGTKVFKNCFALLEKLMKHKHGWVFNAPVDVKTLGLHDYFTIITHPMDLGTIKAKMTKNWYKSPEEFAEDVRLTFHNAMTYNPKGQDVHVMAEMLLQIFEDRWAVIKMEYDREMRYPSGYDLGIPTPTSRKTPLPPHLDMKRIFDRSEFMAYPSTDPRPKPISTTPSSRTPAPKKPKAKDLNKRDMTYEEKQKLSTNLQSLPSEKLDNIVQIIKKRNSSLSQHDDEIEVDIDSVDAETLWELDRFVTNYKKSLSKNRRKKELAEARREAQQNAQQKSWQAQAEVFPGAPQETRTADERNTTTSSPVQAGNPGDNGNRSSSSSSSSSDSGSSSSDSDSDSSSASGS